MQGCVPQPGCLHRSMGNIWSGGKDVLVHMLFWHVYFSPLKQDVFLLSPRTLMGPYGMDRAVHCFDFYNCANGLGEYRTSARDIGVAWSSSNIPLGPSTCVVMCLYVKSDISQKHQFLCLCQGSDSTFCTWEVKIKSKS